MNLSLWWKRGSSCNRCWDFFFFLPLGEAGVFIGSMLLILTSSSMRGESGETCHWVHSFPGDMSYTIGLQYMFGLSLRRMGLGCTWNLPSFVSVRHDTSATTAVHLGGIRIDLDSASVFPSKFSSVSKTSLSSMHSFLCTMPSSSYWNGIGYGKVSA